MVAISLALVFVSSLVFADRVMKRQAWQEQDPAVRRASYEEQKRILQGRRDLWFARWEEERKVDVHSDRATLAWNRCADLDRQLIALAAKEASVI